MLSIDFSVTALALANADRKSGPGLDGHDIRALLSGKDLRAPHDIRFWRAGPSYAVREGPWKLLVVETKAGGAATFLFNLDNDLAETRNLAGSQTRRVAEMKAAYTQWDKANIPPRFVPRKLPVVIDGTPVLMSY